MRKASSVNAKLTVMRYLWIATSRLYNGSAFLPEK
jgi:hypothetical protein